MRDYECLDCGSSMDIALYKKDGYSVILCEDCAEGDFYYDELRDCPSNATREEIDA